MKTIFKSYSQRPFLHLFMSAVIAGSIVVAGAGCKSHKAATSSTSADADAKADAAAKKKAAQEAAAAKAAADAQAAAKREPYDRMEKYFHQIANAGNAANANQVIATALQSFPSSDLPVLIIIYRSGSTVDYDQPTTITNYLNYIKDQKMSPNAVDHIELDSNGKINKIVLIKK